MRVIDAPAALVGILKVWKLACPNTPLGLCFPSKAGEHVDAGRIIRAGLRPVLKAAGIRTVNFHSLRHSYASALLASGVDVVKVSKVLGARGPDDHDRSTRTSSPASDSRSATASTRSTLRLVAVW
jgi:integrase